MATPKDMASAMKENSLADAICDIGYAFTASVEECKNNILNFGTRDLKAADVARIVSVMIKYRADSPDGPQIQTPGNFWISRNKKDGKVLDAGKWNVEIFIQTLKELVATLNWKEVILQLDHQEFLVPDREALNILFSIIRTGLRNSGYPPNVFPVEYICRRWTNMDGQMSLVINILKNPDIFSFADHPLHQVPIDLLKSSPEIDSKDVGTWRNMYLVELLLYASEHGYYAQVSELFKIPLQHCPDVLFLVLLQISPPLTPMRQELFTMLIPIFLVNHPNSAIILYHAWHDQNLNVKPIIMHVMADWYLLGECDHSKLSRILDIAQDLKALSLLLNMQSFPFVIDLACLASRREYLKLDKWLMDKIRDHGEAFIAAMVHFLQRRRPIILANNRSEEQLPKASQLPHETISMLLACMELCLPNVREELQEAIYNVIADWQALMRSKSRPISTRDVTFEPPGLAQQMITSHIDPIAMLTPNMATMSLGVPANPALAMPGTLGPLMATQGSPSRIMGAGANSPFAMVPMQQNPNMGNIGSLPGMIPTPVLEKPRIQESLLYSDSVPVTKEIEDEANVYFKRIYNYPANPSLSIDEALDMLKKFQESPMKRERELFSCMLQNLFEEYKFFPQYPYKELHITSQLFGGIIEKGLVPSYVSLGLAMGLVLDALKKGENSKMYYFGIAALDRFKTRLKDYHKYCEYIKGIPYFKKFPPHIVEYVEYGLQSQDPPMKPQGSLLPAATPTTVPNPNPAVPVTATYSEFVPRSASYTPTISKSNAAGSATSRPSIANITNIDTLLTASDESDKITPPPEAVQDKAAFIFNNLSQLNLESKCQDLKKIITEEHFPWLSQYLVMKRVSIEFNFHTLYANFLDVFKVREVNILVTRETYRNINVLLRSDKVIANFTDRSLLKNLGHWLGMITLARNQPILHVDIDLKTLLLEAYHKGRQDLLFIVPFVAKILESCSKSVVFKPPNPWTMGLMSVLAELHQEANLELNLKFEVEVLCKNLSLDVNDLKPVLFLKDPQKMRTTKSQMGQSKDQQQEAATSAPTNQSMTHQNQPIAHQNQSMTHQNQSTTHQNQSTTHQNQSTTLQNQPMAHQMQMVPTTTHTLEIDEVALPNPVATSASVTEIVGHPEPRFSYFDVNITSASFEQKIFINPSILLLQSYPHLTQYIKPAIERSIQEWIHPVVDRAIKYALTTCEHLIRKDFALDPDETRVRTCAHHMMRNLTAGIAMITCRDQIVITITTNLKTAFNAALMPTTPHQEGIEKAASSVAADNMELACAFIQKTAVEKALPELDKRLSADFEVRKQARQEGRRYYDPVELAYQNEMIPERCRLRAGAPSDVQLAVYERFACKIPGFAQVKDVTLFTPKPLALEAQAPQASNFTQVTSPTHEELSALIAAAEMFISNCFGNTVLAPLGSNMHLLLESLCAARRNFDISAATTLLQKAVEGVLDVNQALSTANPLEMTRYRDTHLRVLKLLEGVYGHTWTAKQITNRLIECRDEIRYNVEAVDVLIRSRFVNLPQYDLAMAHMMDNGNNFPAVSFAMQLVQLHLSGDRTGFLTESDLVHTTEMLARVVTHHRQPPDLLVQPARVDMDPNGDLGERSLLGPTAYIQSGIMQVRSRNYDDPPGLKDKAEIFLREWKNMLLSPITELTLQQNFNGYMHRMNMTGIILSNDMLTRFLRISTGLCIENVYQALAEDRMSPRQGPANREKYYAMCDSFVKLVSLLIKNTERGNLAQKLILLNKVLGMIAGYLLRDQEERGTKFHQLPYHRLLLMLLLDVTLAEPTQEALNYQVMAAFCQTLHLIRPTCAAGFAYAWLEIVAHRVFIDRVLATAHTQQGWGMYSTLLIDLFKFLDPFLRTTELAPPTLTLYKGTLKVLLVLLHDFPEFLCDYHYGFCDVIPPNCIQMRNLILSAFPRNMKLPDPFTPNLKVDLLPEISLPPRAVINYARVLPSSQFKTDLDAYLQARAPVTFLSELRSYMQVLNDPTRRYNSQLMNAVVLYVGTQAIASIRAKGNIPSMATIAHSAHMDIFQSFAVDFDDEGRYLFLNAVANQLRYPNSHTHYFSCVLLHLFAEANSEAIQIQITRMLLERLIANRPHPWGLLITFIELIKNPVYKFWQREFVNSPDIDNYDNKLPPLYNYIVEQVICRISGRKDRNQEEKENSA